MYIKDTESKVFFSIIPDKGYYLAQKNGYPVMDYDRMFMLMRDGMSFADYIDITESLSANSYYKTDTHWRQEKLYDTVKVIADKLGISGDLSEIYKKIKTDRDFYSVYHGQSALLLPGEDLFYLTNAILSECVVTNIENNSITGIYNMTKLNSRDPYEVFLSGASPVLYIDNPNAKTDRELVVFRDSFASSLIPLLMEGYSKITLVDIRYISSDYIDSFVDFNDQDVLFLYSTLILNSSYSMK